MCDDDFSSRDVSKTRTYDVIYNNNCRRYVAFRIVSSDDRTGRGPRHTYRDRGRGDRGDHHQHQVQWCAGEVQLTRPHRPRRPCTMYAGRARRLLCGGRTASSGRRYGDAATRRTRKRGTHAVLQRHGRRRTPDAVPWSSNTARLLHAGTRRYMRARVDAVGYDDGGGYGYGYGGGGGAKKKVHPPADRTRVKAAWKRASTGSRGTRAAAAAAADLRLLSLSCRRRP